MAQSEPPKDYDHYTKLGCACLPPETAFIQRRLLAILAVLARKIPLQAGSTPARATPAILQEKTTCQWGASYRPAAITL